MARARSLRATVWLVAALMTAAAAAGESLVFTPVVTPDSVVFVDESPSMIDDGMLRPLPPAGPVMLDPPYVSGSWWPDGSWPSGGGLADSFDDIWAARPWSWQILPSNVIWSSYLAGPKEPRFATVWYDDTSRDPIVPTQREGWLWDSTLGSCIDPAVRFGFRRASSGLRGSGGGSRIRATRPRRRS